MCVCVCVCVWQEWSRRGERDNAQANPKKRKWDRTRGIHRRARGFVYRSTTRRDYRASSLDRPCVVCYSLYNLEISRFFWVTHLRKNVQTIGYCRCFFGNVINCMFYGHFTLHDTTNIPTWLRLSPWLLSLAHGGGSHIAIAVATVSAGAVRRDR